MHNESISHSRSTGSADPWLVDNMRDGETYGSWVWAAESPRGATDQDGRVPKSAAQSSVGLKYLYASRPWLPVAEAYHNRARWYSPEAGRFLTRDPIGYLGGVNQYMYANGNPIGFRDPWGLLKTDKEGNIISTALYEDTESHIGDTILTGEDQPRDIPITVYELLTNDGLEKITAFAPIDASLHPEYVTNCHGHTFANGQFWIDNDQVNAILRGDGYTRVRSDNLDPNKQYVATFWRAPRSAADGSEPVFLHSAPVSVRTGEIWVSDLGGLATNPQDRPLSRYQRDGHYYFPDIVGGAVRPVRVNVDIYERP